MSGITKIEDFAGASSAQRDLSRELKLAEELALEAGALLLSRQSAELKIDYKKNGEIVTQADLASNEIICRRLAAAFPDDAICSEEDRSARPLFKNNRVWFVDPLDSTSNYVEGGNEYSLSIGLAIKRQAVLGVIYNPVRNELFSGFIGYGVSCNHVPVRATFAATSRPRLLVSSKEWKRGLSVFAQNALVQPMASMAYKLARVAAAREDAVLSLKQRKPWGTCAGTALVIAAGGTVTTLDGQPPTFDCAGTCNGLVAAGRKLHSDILTRARNLRSAMQAHCSA